MKRSILILAIAYLTSCSAARRQEIVPAGTAVVYFSDGGLIAGQGIIKPKVEGCFVIFETEKAMQVLPFYRIWEIQWFLAEGLSKELKPSHTSSIN